MANALMGFSRAKPNKLISILTPTAAIRDGQPIPRDLTSLQKQTWRSLERRGEIGDFNKRASGALNTKKTQKNTKNRKIEAETNRTT